MRQNLKAFIYGLVGLSPFLAAQALVPGSSQDHYQNIPERNLFALRPPPQVRNEPIPPQLTKILLTGITTILGDKRALMKTLLPPGKPGDQAKEQSLILKEGQREGEIEVVAIDDKAGSVKVNNSGTVMVLTFEKDGVKLPTAPPGPGAPTTLPSPTNGQPMRAALQPNPSFAPGGMNGSSKFRALPTRNLRSSPPGGIGPTTGAEGAPSGTAGETVAPPTGTPTGLAPAASLPSDLTAEEQAIIQDLQRQAGQQSTALPPLPSPAATPGVSDTATPPATGTVPSWPPQILPQ